MHLPAIFITFLLSVLCVLGANAPLPFLNYLDQPKLVGRHTGPDGGVYASTAQCLAWSPNSNILAVGSFDRTISLWQIDGQARGKHFPPGKLIGKLIKNSRLDEPVNSVEGMAWHPKGSILAAFGWGFGNPFGKKGEQHGEVLTLWDISTGKPLSLIRHPLPVVGASWSPSGSILATAEGDVKHFWTINSDVVLGKRTFVVRNKFSIRQADGSNFTRMSWSPNGKYIVSGSLDKTVKVWDPSNGRVKYTFKGHANVVRSVDWSPDGRHIVSGSEDKTIRVWAFNNGDLANHPNGKSVVTYKFEKPITKVEWSPDCKYIAIAQGNNFQMLRFNKGEWLNAPPRWAAINDIAWSPNGKFLAVSYGRTAEVWNLAR